MHLKKVFVPFLMSDVSNATQQMACVKSKVLFVLFFKKLSRFQRPYEHLHLCKITNQ